MRWAGDTTTGDRAELPFEPHFRAWAMVSTTARECPGAFRCPSGRDCFAEDARARAAEADVIVVNTHLYGAHLASGGAVLPEHQVVVFDEAHEVEDVMTDSLGPRGRPGPVPGPGHRGPPGARHGRRRGRPGRRGGGRPGRRVPPGAPPVVGTAGAAPGAGRGRGHRRPRQDGSGTDGTGTGPGRDGPVTPSRRRSRPASTSGWPRCRPRRPGRPDGQGDRSPAPGPRRPGPPPWAATPTSAPCWPWPPAGSGAWSTTCAGSEREAGDLEASTERSRRDRVLLAAGHLAADLARLALLGDEEVAWVEDGNRAPALRVSPIDVGPILAEQLWGSVTGILTSATVPIGLAERLGMPLDATDTLDVGSPFDYRAHSLLYVASSLPDRRRPEAEPALHDELETLITAAGGRTLALFTSWRAMRAAVEALADRLAVPDPVPVRPAQAGPGRGVPGRRVGLPVRHPRVLAGGGRTRPDPQPRHHRPDPLPATRRPRPRGPPGAGRARGLRPRSTCPGPAPCWPRGRDGSSARPPTGAWWPCSTAAWPRPATAGRCSSGSRR